MIVSVQDTGLFAQKSEQKSAQEQMMTNPDMMQNMMKQNLGGIIPQVTGFYHSSLPYVSGYCAACITSKIWASLDSIFIFSHLHFGQWVVSPLGHPYADWWPVSSIQMHALPPVA